MIMVEKEIQIMKKKKSYVTKHNKNKFSYAHIMRVIWSLIGTIDCKCTLGFALGCLWHG